MRLLFVFCGVCYVVPWLWKKIWMQENIIIFQIFCAFLKDMLMRRLCPACFKRSYTLTMVFELGLK